MMLGKTVQNLPLKSLVQCIGINCISKRNVAEQQRRMPGTIKDSTDLKGEKEVKEINFRTCNFSAGPSAIDLSVLEEAKKYFSNYNNSGMGIFEMSHRDESGDVQKLICNLSHRISLLLNIPQNYHIFFMHGGAHSQFASIPLNICGLNNKSSMHGIGGYINTGYWSQRAQNEANKFIDTVTICKTDGKSIPDINDWKIPENCEYIHFCANETISGIEFLSDPDLPLNSPPLIGDFTSTLFSRPIDITKYGMIYASSGKNFGPSGICICIIKDELLELSKVNNDKIPGILNWNEFAKSTPIHSIYNTPAIFQLFMIDLTMQKVYGEKFDYDIDRVTKWIKKRANTIYKIIEEYPQIYNNNIDIECKSNMNIPFRIFDYTEHRIDSVLEYKFAKQAEEEWFLYNLNGHHSVGGMRISLYSGIPDESIKAVAKFMHYFADYHTGN